MAENPSQKSSNSKPVKSENTPIADKILPPPEAGIGFVRFMGEAGHNLSAVGNWVYAMYAASLMIGGAAMGPLGVVVPGVMAAALAFQGLRAVYKADMNERTAEMTMGIEEGEAKKASTKWFDQKLSTKYQRSSAVVGTIAGGFSGLLGVGVLTALGVSMTATGAWIGIAAAALGLGAYQWFVSKAEVSNYEALGTLDPKKQSNFWFLVKLGKIPFSVLSLLGFGGLRGFSVIAEIVSGIRAKKALKMYEMTNEKTKEADAVSAKQGSEANVHAADTTVKNEQPESAPETDVEPNKGENQNQIGDENQQQVDGQPLRADNQPSENAQQRVDQAAENSNAAQDT